MRHIMPQLRRLKLRPTMTAMDFMNLRAPEFTRVDAITQAVSGAVYLVVGFGAWWRAPRDIRTRVFLGFSSANVVVFAVPVVTWAWGLTAGGLLPRKATAAMLAGLGVGALLLFHFTQVFPRRRPWITSAGVQMWVVYILTPIVITGLILFMPDNPALITAPYVLAVLVFGFPLLVLLGFVVPVAAIFSLVKSHREVQRDGLTLMKRPLEWILISQIAGGTLAVVFAPVLMAIAPNSAVQVGLTLAVTALGLLTPFAVAAAVWKFGMLQIDPG